jgi:hypothetical protein
MATDTFHTTGLLALRLGVQAQHVERLCRRNLIPYQWAGRVRVIRERDIPAVQEALREAGYLRDPAPVA